MTGHCPTCMKVVRPAHEIPAHRPPKSAARTSTSIREPRAARGSTGIMALALIMLLAATSLALLTTVKTQITVSRHSRDFLFARQNLDAALGNASSGLNAIPAKSNDHGTVEHEGFDLTSTWSWTRTFNNGTDLHYGGTVQAEGTFSRNTQDTERGWRARLVGSRPILDGEPTYGVAAASAWVSTLSSEDDSTVTGRVEGDWHAYGVGTITIPASTDVDRVISYDDAAAIDGDARFVRSTLTATLDERLLNGRATTCAQRGGLGRFVASTNPGGPVLNAGQLSCYYSIIIDVPTRVTGGGVAAVVAYGDIDIRANLLNQAGNELHLYTASGTVKFRGNPTIAAYVFAPNALCKTYSAATVTFTGSLACRQIQMSGTFRPGTVPSSEHLVSGLPAEPTAWITYLENPGYLDRFTD